MLKEKKIQIKKRTEESDKISVRRQTVVELSSLLESVV